MSGETPASTETATPAPATASADSSPAPAESAASAAETVEESNPDRTKSEAEPSTEGKADDVKADDAKAEDDFLAETDDDDAKGEADSQADAKQDGESEAYQPFTLPEGLELDTEALAKATPIFRKLNLNQEGAQELVSLQAEIMQSAVQAYHETLAEGHAKNLKAWAAETKAHPEFGGDNLKASKAHAAKALGLEPAARKVLVEYGLDRHPSVFALLARVGSKLSEDSLVREDAGAAVKSAPTRDADLFYS